MTTTSITVLSEMSREGVDCYLAERGFERADHLFSTDESRESALATALDLDYAALEEEMDLALYATADGCWALAVGRELAVEFRPGTVISLVGYERESLTNPTLPSELVIDERGACEAHYQEGDGSGEFVTYTSLGECLEAHDIDPDHLVDYLDDAGRYLDASYVAAKTDPHAVERAQAAAQVATTLRQGRSQA